MINRKNSTKATLLDRKGSYSDNRSQETKMLFDECQKKEGLKKKLEELQKNLNTIKKDIGI